MTPNAQKALIAVSGLVILFNAFGLVTGARAAKASALEVRVLKGDIKKIDEEITRLRALVQSYEKEKRDAASTTAAAATPAPAATPASK